MNSLYTDSELTERYLHLMESSLAASHSPDQSDMESAAFESFFESLITRAYASLQSLSEEQLPELHFHVGRGELHALARWDAEAFFADQRGIHAGLSFVSKLDAAILVLSAYLMENYLWQVSPLVVNTPPTSQPSSPYDKLIPFSLYTGRLISIAKVVEPTDFPAEALSLYSAHLIPEAEARDGYQKRPFELIMAYLQEARLAAGRTDVDERAVARALPKPLIDPVDFFSHFDADEAVKAYLDPVEGPYLLRLHLQVLLDGLYFVLAHEISHYQLRHHQEHREAMAQRREDEAEADKAALALLNGMSGFQPRSLIITFHCARGAQDESPPDRLDHPLARNRLLILVDTLLAETGDDALRADVNAGLALLLSHLEPQYLTFGWPNEDPEDVNILISSYSDMDYTAHVMVYINRPPRHAGSEDAFRENAFLVAHLAYKIWFEVRDRINHEKVYAWGGAGYHPTIRPDDLFTINHPESVFSRLHLPIPAPPEFCLKWPDAEFAVKKIELLVPRARCKGPGGKAKCDPVLL